MPDPSWTAKQAGSPQANGHYTHEGERDARPCFTIFPDGPWIVWVTNTQRWYICPNPDSPGTNTLYYTDPKDWDLPCSTWQRAGEGVDPPPTITPWRPPPRPSTINHLVDGKVDPINIVNPHPLLSWSFIPTEFGPGQAAYQVQVATTHALLDAQTPDLWDSGIVEAWTEYAIYEGVPLPDWDILHWTVRVRDESGRWSDDW